MAGVLLIGMVIGRDAIVLFELPSFTLHEPIQGMHVLMVDYVCESVSGSRMEQYSAMRYGTHWEGIRFPDWVAVQDYHCSIHVMAHTPASGALALFRLHLPHITSP